MKDQKMLQIPTSHLPGRTSSRQWITGAIAAVILCTSSIARAQQVEDHYKVDNIPTPPGLDPQVGGLDFMPDGRLVACFHRGEVYTFHPETSEWRFFAEGLQEPLGVVAVSNHEVVVMQRSELTRIQDLDRDGIADSYLTLWDGFGMTGNYHEFAFGPVLTPEGNFVVSLNLASNGASIRPEIRGAFTDIGLPRGDFYDRPWGQVKNAAGRMYSRVPWRGWVVEVTPDGSARPIAPGFRSPNGMGYDLDGNLFVTDNQGDWLGTSKAYHVEKGKFYGHPASLVWKDGWTRNPLDVPAEELDSLRTPAAFLFPQGEVANSPTQPLCDTTSGAFGPFEGQMLVGEMNVPRILRLVPDRVNGVLQGAVIPFIDNGGLRRGINRMVFSPDNELYIGQTALSWAGDKGIQKITWTGRTPMEVRDIHMVENGFSVTFTLPVDRSSLDGLMKTVATWTYHYHKSYGSPKVDQVAVPVTAAVLSADGRTLQIQLERLRQGYVHSLDFSGIKAAGGPGILNPVATYHAVQIP